MSIDGRTPTIVGTAQSIQRQTDWAEPADAKGPIELMLEAVTSAAADAGSTSLLKKVGWIGVAGGMWSYTNPGQLIAARIGAPGAATCLSAISGSAPQDMVGIAAERIASGQLDVALIVGGEARATSLRLKKRDLPLPWLTAPGEGTPEVVTGLTDPAIAETLYLGAAAPGYALMEDSLRRSLGRSIDEQRDHIAALWEGFSKVASTNPYAWDPTPHSATEIREPTPDNRMICFPYPKAMVANNTVDLASAILLCSTDAANAAGVSTDQRVYPHVCTGAHDTWRLVNRDVLHKAPALRLAGRAAFGHVGIGPDEITRLELYACFPSIVEMSAAALGFDSGRELTVTGGLGFAGAAIANSAGHAIAAMIPQLRGGGYGFLHANGGNATKHAFGIYSDRPPREFCRIDCQAQVDFQARPEAPEGWAGDGPVEAATVMFDRDGPTHVIAAIRTGADERGFVKTSDPDLVAQAMIDGLETMRGPLPGARPIG